MEVTVKTDVTTEPLLVVLTEGGEKYINQFLSYPTTGGSTAELAIIGKMCAAARELCEKELNKSLASKTITVFYPYAELKEMKFIAQLPYGPHASISSVKVDYADGSDDLLLVENTDYYVSGNQYKTINLPEISGTVGSGQVSGYTIEIVAGYGASGCETIPESLKMAMAKQVCQWYAKRDEYNQTLSSETRNTLQKFSNNIWI
jgi:uncharacterized phiE125 gp8 family phage protein